MLVCWSRGLVERRDGGRSIKGLGRIVLGATLAGYHEWAYGKGIEGFFVGPEGSRTAGAGFAGLEFVGKLLFSERCLRWVLL